MSKYYNNKLFLFFIIFPFFNPTALKYIPALSGIYDIIQVWKLLSILVIIVSYFLRRKVSTVIGLIILFEVASMATSFANGVFYSKIITDALLYVGISMLTEIALYVNFKRFYKMFFANAFWFGVANFVLCLLYPDGLRMATLYTKWENPLYLLTIDNGMIKELIPVLLMAYLGKLCLDNRKEKQKIDLYFYAAQAICLVTLLIVGSATGLIIYTAITISMVCANFKVKWRIPYKVLLAILVAFMVIVVIAGSDLKIVSIIAGAFGREGNFTGRTLLWTLAIDMIQERPFIGYGYTAGSLEVWGGTFSSHNIFLELALQGGIIYLSLFVILIMYALKRNRKATVCYSNTMSVAIFSYLLVGLMETGLTPFLFVFIVLACYPDFNTDAQMKRITF